jgi:hypothetical protein
MNNILRAMALSAVVGAALPAQSLPSNSDSTRSNPAPIPAALAKAARAVVISQQAPPVANRLMPDISAIGDLVADFSPKGSTQEGGTRFGVRELELALGAAVDPYFRADFILGISDEEGIAIEEAYATTTSLPAGLQLRLGRYHMPFGKQNTTHRAELHTIEYPYVLQRFFGPEGLKGTGIYASRVFSPFGFYQELIVTAVDRAGEAPEEELVTPEPINKELSGIGYSARLRNYFDVSEAANFEISASALTGAREQPLVTAPDAVSARQTHVGADVTFRWRPLQEGNYRSFILQGEFIRQINEPVDVAGYAGPDRDFNGFYTFARWQLTRRGHVGARFDNVEDPELGGETLRALSGYLEWFPSEFSKINAAYERVEMYPGSGSTGVNRILLQATFSVGPHRPHPF